jgi:hypothetical protein
MRLWFESCVPGATFALPGNCPESAQTTRIGAYCPGLVVFD